VANTKSVTLIIERKLDKSPLLPLGTSEVKYYEFRQNNSRGVFHVDDNFGENVIIAARTADEANQRAEKIGVYFAGCATGRDCDCCGDRWSSIWRNDKGTSTPSIYGKSIEDSLSGEIYSMRETVVVHHADGTRERFTRVKR